MSEDTVIEHRGWCVKCQRGVPAKIGELCPFCLESYDGNGYVVHTTLISPQEAEERHRRWAEAIKLARRKSTTHAQKGVQEVAEEIAQRVKSELEEKILAQGKVIAEQQKLLDAKKSEVASDPAEKKRRGRPKLIPEPVQE